MTGIGTYAKELITHLLKIDKSNRYLLFSIKSPIPSRKVSFPCPDADNVSCRSLVFPYRCLNLLWKFKLFPVEKFFKEIDILHTLDRVTPYTKKARVIVTVHDMSWYGAGSGGGERSSSYKETMESLKRADMVITVSEFSKNEIIKYLPFLREKIRITRSGVSERFHPMDKGRMPEEIRKKYPWDDYILYLGTLEDPRKNVELIVNAYAHLKKAKKTEKRLLLCGRISRYSRSLLQLIKKINLPGDIIVHSRWIPDSDIPYIYNKARLVLLPSLYEGFGLPVLESMACGKPIIVSDIPPLREVGSGAATFIDPKNQEELGRAIETLLSDDKLYNTMVEKGLKRSKEFTWTRTAKETLNVYEECHAR